MQLLVLRLLLTPVLMATCLAAGRKWGHRAGGLLLGLPLVSGPVSVLLFMERGKGFALAAAHSTLVGFVASGAFYVCYAGLSARLRWFLSLPLSLAAFAATAWVIEPLALDPLRSGLLVLGTLVLLARSVSTPRPAAEPRSPRKREVALQMLVAVAIVVASTTWAASLGSHVAGLLVTVPAISAVMATAEIRRTGRGAANEMLRGAVIGTWGGAAFFTVVGTLLAAAGPAYAYTTAAAAAMLTGLVGARVQARPA